MKIRKKKRNPVKSVNCWLCKGKHLSAPMIRSPGFSMDAFYCPEMKASFVCSINGKCFTKVAK